MIPLYKKITRPSSLSFSSSLETPPEFDTPWHYHPEYELILIMNARGTRFMGDDISEFKEVELVLVGPNLPHFWKEENLRSSKDHPKPFACVIHFSEDFLGNRIFELEEGKQIREMLDNSRYGLVFNEGPESILVKRIQELISDEDFNRIIGLLDILNILSKRKNFKMLCSKGFVNIHNKKNSEKINVVVEYAMTNFKEKVVLEEVAELVHMSKSSFCRFFKKSTGRTYIDFLRDIRIGYACKLILEDNLGITQIAYECGYENISNFNRQFKINKKMTPFKYKQHYLNKAEQFL